MELKDIKDLVKLLDKSGLTELEFDDGDTRIYLSKAVQTVQVAQAVQPMPAAVQAPMAQSVTDGNVVPAAESGNVIESPMIGTYYSSSTPGGAPFVSVGDTVDKGQTLCIIEAMKIMNIIEAEYRCKIMRVLAENGTPVEYGQPIFLVEPI